MPRKRLKVFKTEAVSHSYSCGIMIVAAFDEKQACELANGVRSTVWNQYYEKAVELPDLACKGEPKVICKMEHGE